MPFKGSRSGGWVHLRVKTVKGQEKKANKIKNELISKSLRQNYMSKPL